MKIGIIGAGAIGHAIAKDLVKAGYQVILSSESGSVREAAAAAAADVVFVVASSRQLSDLPAWGGRIVVDTTNSIGALVPGARLVKAFNTLPAPLLLADPIPRAGDRVMFLCGDDQDAKATVAKIIEAMGFAPIDLGTLVEGRKLQQFAAASLPSLDLVKFSRRAK